MMLISLTGALVQDLICPTPPETGYGLEGPTYKEIIIEDGSHVANPRNAFCIEQRATAKSKEARVRVFGLFLLLPRLAPVGLIAR